MAGRNTPNCIVQYRELKKRNPDTILLFRMGDFYEIFGDDAEKVAKCLGLAVTTYKKGDDSLAMVGFPLWSLESSLQTLVAAGMQVAVCEQVTDPAEIKRLAKRDIDRVVTEGNLND